MDHPPPGLAGRMTPRIEPDESQSSGIRGPMKGEPMFPRRSRQGALTVLVALALPLAACGGQTPATQSPDPPSWFVGERDRTTPATPPERQPVSRGGRFRVRACEARRPCRRGRAPREHGDENPNLHSGWGGGGYGGPGRVEGRVDRPPARPIRVLVAGGSFDCRNAGRDVAAHPAARRCSGARSALCYDRLAGGW